MFAKLEMIGYDIEHRIEIPAPMVLMIGLAVIGTLIWVAILIWLSRRRKR